jgi:hypothetical protein
LAPGFGDRAGADRLLARAAQAAGSAGLRCLVSYRAIGELAVYTREAIGVIEYPDGRGYAAAVFTQGRQPRPNDAAVNTAIGTTAAAAVTILAEDAPRQHRPG